MPTTHSSHLKTVKLSIPLPQSYIPSSLEYEITEENLKRVKDLNHLKTLLRNAYIRYKIDQETVNKLLKHKDLSKIAAFLKQHIGDLLIRQREITVINYLAEHPNPKAIFPLIQHFCGDNLPTLDVLNFLSTFEMETAASFKMILHPMNQQGLLTHGNLEKLLHRFYPDWSNRKLPKENALKRYLRIEETLKFEEFNTLSEMQLFYGIISLCPVTSDQFDVLLNFSADELRNAHHLAYVTYYNYLPHPNPFERLMMHISNPHVGRLCHAHSLGVITEEMMNGILAGKITEELQGNDYITIKEAKDIGEHLSQPHKTDFLRIVDELRFNGILTRSNIRLVLESVNHLGKTNAIFHILQNTSFLTQCHFSPKARLDASLKFAMTVDHPFEVACALMHLKYLSNFEQIFQMDKDTLLLLTEHYCETRYELERSEDWSATLHARYRPHAPINPSSLFARQNSPTSQHEPIEGSKKAEERASSPSLSDI